MENMGQRIQKLIPAIPGTIREVLLRCGRKNCVCSTGHDRDKHGPYYFWSYKSEGRLTSVSLTAAEAKQFQHWIDNRRAIEKLVDEIMEKGAQKALAGRKVSKPARKAKNDV